MTIPLSSIDEGVRTRKDYGDLSGLKSSLTSLGQIHPIVLFNKLNNTSSPQPFLLVAGGRRFRAMKELGATMLHEGLEGVLEPGRFAYIVKDHQGEDVLKEAELDENLYRLKPKWTEDVLLISDIHAAKRAKEGSRWTQYQTAALLGPGYGKASISYYLQIAKLIRSDDTQIIQCEGVTDAIAVMIKRKEDEALAEMQRRTQGTTALSTASFLDVINLGGPRNTVPFNFQKTPEAGKEGDATCQSSTTQDVIVPNVGETGPTSDPSAPVTIPLSRMFLCADSLIVMSEMPPSSIDHVVTDIPYGIDMKNLDTMQNIEDVSAEHDVKANVSLMEPFLAQSFRLVKSGGFCVFFYDLDWHEYLQSTAEMIGWKVQRWPLIAYKTSACQNNAAQYNFTKNYESIMVLRRDEKTVLRSQQPTSVWMGDFAAERRLYNNPFAKPFTLWKWIYDAISFPGQSTLDPFCGEMSACRAAVNCGLVPFGIELKEQHFLRGLELMKGVYSLLHSSNVRFE